MKATAFVFLFLLKFMAIINRETREIRQNKTNLKNFLLFRVFRVFRGWKLFLATS